jgi:hypothetical protein
MAENRTQGTAKLAKGTFLVPTLSTFYVEGGVGGTPRT